MCCASGFGCDFGDLGMVSLRFAVGVVWGWLLVRAFAGCCYIGCAVVCRLLMDV